MSKPVIPKVSFDDIGMPKGIVRAGAGVQEIQVGYDQVTDSVTVAPDTVSKGSSVRFKDPSGGQLKIVFLSPSGKPVETVFDTDVYTFTVGGVYHFKCFFTLPGANGEISPRYGGIIDVLPQRP